MEFMESNSIPKPTRTSGSAIASLVCGIFGCVPFLTGLAAIILGVVGIKKTRDPQVTGKGMAIAGLVLGVLNILGWTVASVAIGFGVVAVFKASEPARLTAFEFTRDLTEGKVDEALALSVEGMDRAKLVALSEQMKPWGTIQSLPMTSVNIQDKNGTVEFTMGGTATFSNQTRSYTVTLRKVGESYKVLKVDFP